MEVFTDIMEPGIELIGSKGYLIPDYLTIQSVEIITLDDRINPTALLPQTAYVYNHNLYLTDSKGNIAFIDCMLQITTPTKPLRESHREYRKAGSKERDAGHFGLSLGQHPSIAMEQDRTMNRFGVWRVFEKYWTELLNLGKTIHLLGVFAEGDERTYSPFWCIREETDGNICEYVFTNDDEQ